MSLSCFAASAESPGICLTGLGHPADASCAAPAGAGSRPGPAGAQPVDSRGQPVTNLAEAGSPSDMDAETSMLLLYNRQPFCLRVTTEKRFSDITIKDILDLAHKALLEYSSILPSQFGARARENLQLRVITDEVRTLDVHTKRVAAKPRSRHLSIATGCRIHLHPIQRTPPPTSQGLVRDSRLVSKLKRLGEGRGNITLLRRAQCESCLRCNKDPIIRYRHVYVMHRLLSACLTLRSQTAHRPSHLVFGD